MSLPFRTALSCTSGSPHGGEPGIAVDRVEDVMGDASQATVVDARLRGWINHADERVPIALLGGSLASWMAQSETWSLHLYARAMRDAERGGVCWTPLLDRMAVTGIWPTQKGRVVLGGTVSVVTPLSPAHVLHPLRQWLREQTDGAAFAPLATFEAPALRALVQSRLAVLPAVASYTGEFPGERSASALPDALPSAVALAEAPPADAYSPHGVLRSAVVTPHVAHPTAPAPDAGARAAARSTVPREEPHYSPAQVAGLLHVASEATGRSDESQVRPEIRRAIDTLIEYRALGAAHLYSLYTACRMVKTWIVRIVAHASATIELWRAALRDNNWIEVRESIVKSSQARRDSVIRLILSRCSSAEVLCALCLDGDLPDVPRILRRVVRADPFGLLDALGEAMRTTGLKMAAGDLEPLTRHADAQVRQRASALLPLLAHPA